MSDDLDAIDRHIAELRGFVWNDKGWFVPPKNERWEFTLGKKARVWARFDMKPTRDARQAMVLLEELLQHAFARISRCHTGEYLVEWSASGYSWYLVIDAVFLISICKAWCAWKEARWATR